MSCKWAEVGSESSLELAAAPAHGKAALVRLQVHSLILLLRSWLLPLVQLAAN